MKGSQCPRARGFGTRVLQDFLATVSLQKAGTRARPTSRSGTCPSCPRAPWPAAELGPEARQPAQSPRRSTATPRAASPHSLPSVGRTRFLNNVSQNDTQRELVENKALFTQTHPQAHCLIQNQHTLIEHILRAGVVPGTQMTKAGSFPSEPVV